MTLAYSSRLLYLSLAAFFLVQVSASAAAWLLIPAALRRASQVAPRSGARLLFTLRVAPTALSLLLVAALCVPSYLWLEPEQSVEEAGVICSVAALLAAAVWSASIARVLRAVARSFQYRARCRRGGTQVHLEGQSAPVWVIDDAKGALALAGILRPQLFISRRVLTQLTADQLSVVMRHEDAHRSSGDNLKRLFLLLSPDILPFFHGFARLEKNWARLTEWAADDHAVDGDTGRSLSLASALVRVARLGPVSYPSPIITSCLDDECDLAARVDRLLMPPPAVASSKVRTPLSATVAAGGLTALLVAVMLHPGTLHSVHSLLEYLIR